MEKIIDRILTDFRWTLKYFNDFCSVNNLNRSSRSAFKSSLQIELSRLNNESDTLKRNISESKPKSTKGINPVTTWGDYDSLDYIHSNKKINRNNYSTKLLNLNKKISVLDNMLQIVNLYTGKETTPTKENENNIKVSSKYSEYGELNKLLYELLELPEFKNLDIPKHKTLKANHKTAIKKLLTTKFPEFPIEKWDSLLTKLKTQHDYSKSRDRNN